MNDLDVFRETIRSAGLEPPDVIEADGKLHRFSSNGKHGDDAGWYVYYGDGISAGSFGDWRTGIKENWRSDIGRALSPAEDSAHRAKVEAMRRDCEAEKVRRHMEASTKAAAFWNEAHPAPVDHPYLTRKAIKAHGICLHNGALVIPLRDGSALHSLQFIYENGEKRDFSPGDVWPDAISPSATTRARQRCASPKGSQPARRSTRRLATLLLWHSMLAISTRWRGRCASSCPT